MINFKKIIKNMKTGEYFMHINWERTQKQLEKSQMTRSIDTKENLPCGCHRILNKFEVFMNEIKVHGLRKKKCMQTNKSDTMN